MTLTQLECFLAVVREGHFGRAAQRLGRSTPAISVQIQRLESELGVTLFERAGRRVAPTGAADILAPSAQRILSEVRDSANRVDALRQGKRGAVRIGVVPTVAAHFLPAILQRYRAQLPETSISLREEGQTPNLFPLLDSNEIEMAICRGPFRTRTFKSVPLITEEYGLAVSSSHPLAGRARVSVSALQNEQFVVYKAPEHANRLVVFEMCRQAGFEPQIAFESEQAETIQSLAAANLGVAVLPEMVLRAGAGRGLAMVRLHSPAKQRTIVATWKKGRYLSLFARAFIACAESQAAALA